MAFRVPRAGPPPGRGPLRDVIDRLRQEGERRASAGRADAVLGHQLGTAHDLGWIRPAAFFAGAESSLSSTTAPFGHLLGRLLRPARHHAVGSSHRPPPVARRRSGRQVVSDTHLLGHQRRGFQVAQRKLTVARFVEARGSSHRSAAQPGRPSARPQRCPGTAADHGLPRRRRSGYPPCAKQSRLGRLGHGFTARRQRRNRHEDVTHVLQTIAQTGQIGVGSRPRRSTSWKAPPHGASDGATAVGSGRAAIVGSEKPNQRTGGMPSSWAAACHKRPGRRLDGRCARPSLRSSHVPKAAAAARGRWLLPPWRWIGTRGLGSAPITGSTLGLQHLRAAHGHGLLDRRRDGRLDGLALLCAPAIVEGERCQRRRHRRRRPDPFAAHWLPSISLVSDPGCDRFASRSASSVSTSDPRLPCFLHRRQPAAAGLHGDLAVMNTNWVCGDIRLSHLAVALGVRGDRRCIDLVAMQKGAGLSWNMENAAQCASGPSRRQQLDRTVFLARRLGHDGDRIEDHHRRSSTSLASLPNSAGRAAEMTINRIASWAARVSLSIRGCILQRIDGASRSSVWVSG